MKSTTLIVLSMLLIATSSMAEIVATGGAPSRSHTTVRRPGRSRAIPSTTPRFASSTERQGVTLAAPLNVNITALGIYDETGDLTPGVIPAGTAVDSHLISDGLGAGVTTYQPAGLQFRGAELDENDVIEVGCDFISVNLESFHTLDHIRVITARNQLCGEGCPSGFWKQCSGKKTAVVQRRITQYLAAGFSPNGDVNAAFGRRRAPDCADRRGGADQRQPSGHRLPPHPGGGHRPRAKRQRGQAARAHRFRAR